MVDVNRTLSRNRTQIEVSGSFVGVHAHRIVVVSVADSRKSDLLIEVVVVVVVEGRKWRRSNEGVGGERAEAELNGGPQIRITWVDDISNVLNQLWD